MGKADSTYTLANSTEAQGTCPDVPAGCKLLFLESDASEVLHECPFLPIKTVCSIHEGPVGVL